MDLAEKINRVSRLEGEFTLRSGKKSTEYFDKYQFESDPQLLMEIAKEISEFVPVDIDYLAAMEMGGIPIATMLSYYLDIPVVYVRKESKGYGTDKVAEGPDIVGKRLCIVEDVITSGGQVVLSTNQLRHLGATVNYCVCVIEREEGGRKNLDAAGIQLQSLFQKSDLKNVSQAI